MSIGSNCAGIVLLDGKKRQFKGPIDNVIIKGYFAIEALLLNKYYELMYSSSYTIRKRYIEKAEDFPLLYDFGFVEILHNDPMDIKYKLNLVKRINEFNTFLNNVKNKDNYYFIFTFNNYYINDHTHELNSSAFIQLIELLTDYGIKDKVIFIQTKNPKNPNHNYLNEWSIQLNEYIKNYKLKNIIIENVDEDDTTLSYNKFRKEIEKVLCI